MYLHFSALGYIRIVSELELLQGMLCECIKMLT